MQREDLVKKLDKYDIDYSQWGTGTLKSVEELLQEIELGESELILHEDALMRQISFVGAQIYYEEDENTVHRLVEKYQILKDGRKRSRRLSFSVCEKMYVYERPEMAIFRGIEEELGIMDDLVLEQLRIKQYIKDSYSYPGLECRYIEYGFKVYFDEKQYVSEGYHEVGENETSHFIWVEEP